MNGIDLEQLDREHSVRLNVSEPGKPFLPFAEGPCNLDPALLEYTPPVESRQGSEDLRGLYPLEMIPGKNDDSMNSTFGNREAQDRETSVLYLNTADAAGRGIVSGDQVRVFNGRGSLTLRAEVDGVTGPGVVSTPSTRWSKRAGPAQLQRADLGAVDRLGWRGNLLQ